MPYPARVIRRPSHSPFFTLLPSLLLCACSSGEATSSASASAQAVPASATASAASAAPASPAASPKGGALPPSESKDECLSECAKDTTDAAEFYCGTDKKSYTACEWICDGVPKGVGVYPGKCNADGSPPARRPPLAADGVLICDWFDNKGEWVAVECEEATDDDDAANSEFGGKGVLPKGAAPLDAPEKELPEEVSHRARFGSIKNQGAAPSCISFASTALLEGAVAGATSSKIVLSEMHFLSRYHTTSYNDAIAKLSLGAALADAAKAEGLAYDAAIADGWLQGESQPPADKVSALDAKVAFEVATVREIVAEGGGRPTAKQLQAAIADGEDLSVGFRMSDNWYTDNLLPGGVIEDYPRGRNFGHAVVLIGYKTIEGRKYFEIRNSWGSAWGDSGYGWISFETAEANLQVAATVSARRKDDVVVDDCPKGQAAGFDGKCVKVCPSGALEQNGACPEDGGCPEGRVKDASNVCVRACAEGKRDLDDDLSVECLGEGCLFSIPSGQYGCKAEEGEVCEHYCQAPDCEMVESKNEFGVAVIGCGPSD